MQYYKRGKHAADSTDMQEFMIAPVGAKTFTEAMQMLKEIFELLGKVVESKGYDKKLGRRGGDMRHTSKAAIGKRLSLFLEAVQKQTTNSVVILFFFGYCSKRIKEKYDIEYYKSLVEEFPIFSIEDPFALRMIGQNG